MLRHMVRSVALFGAALLLAGGAWGQADIMRFEQSNNAGFVIAAEYFGPAGREVVISGFDGNVATTDAVEAPFVAITPDPTNTGSAAGGISSGNEALIRFSLMGATFSQTVGPQSLSLKASASACAQEPVSERLSARVADGGMRGDSHVTFRATTGTDVLGSICFFVPNLMVTLADISEGVRGVTLAVSVEPVTTSGTYFFTEIVGELAGNAADSPRMPAAATLLTVQPALDTSLGTGGMGMVAIADRTMIASGGMPDPSASADMAAMGLLVGQLTINAMEGDEILAVMQDDTGRVTAYSTDGGLDSRLAGQVMVSVTGPFQEGDKVVVAKGTNVQQVMPMDGMASAAVPIMHDPDMPTNIIYVPGGVQELRPSTFMASAKYAFNDTANNNDLMIMGSMASIDFAGLDLEGYAYGVVKAGGMDTSYVRATCEAPGGMCSVFFDCTDQDGMSTFTGPEEIGAGVTAVWSSAAIAEAIGGGWDRGRGRCDFYSDHPLAIQHMVRAGHTLINSSVVVGRGLDERTDRMQGTNLMNICRSVGTAPMVDTDGMVTNADDVTRCYPGMP